MFDIKSINKDWTIFLDRDGVINHEKHMDYVYTYDEFEFYQGVPEAIRILSERAKYIIVTTNQRGVGRGIMSESALIDIHQKMTLDIEKAGGRIDAIYYCTAMENSHPNRKPNPGMIFQAKADFPDIDLKKALIVGNNLSDMEFGRNGGIHTVFVRTTHPGQATPHAWIDKDYPGLPDFAKALQEG